MAMAIQSPEETQRAREARAERKIERYVRRAHRALDETLERAREARREGEAPKLDLSSGVIVFSDHHRGTRTRADDFLRSERAYNSALQYYYHLGYTLVGLGDVEELWQELPGAVLDAYRRTVALEAAFHREGRYVRFWGNHDDEWASPSAVERHLEPAYRREGGPPLRVHESLLVDIVEGARVPGQLFFLHGHQGTANSDRFSRWTRLPVRYLYRPLQRLTGYSYNTPATDWLLRAGHDAAMYEWAAAQKGIVLVAGHTHRPVFASNLEASGIQAAIDLLRTKLDDAGDPELRVQLAERSAELEWVLAQNRQNPGFENVRPMERPCYFNTGCCCYLDGDITGLEIVDGEIRLVRWPDHADRPKPQVLARASLGEVVEGCCGVGER
jgi:hypothetical protein